MDLSVGINKQDSTDGTLIVFSILEVDILIQTVFGFTVNSTGIGNFTPGAMLTHLD